MPQPNDAPIFSDGIHLTVQADGSCVPSQPLIDLLMTSRRNYDWPKRTGANISQQKIRSLEDTVANRLKNLNPSNAHSIVVDVSHWAGNNANSHRKIIGASQAQRVVFETAISNLLEPGTARNGVDLLSASTGISLVIASKIYRFCAPHSGAAVDRHASYFFNSLPKSNGGKATTFSREWLNGARTTSRLATYSARGYMYNLDHYFDTYLPLLNNIASSLNVLNFKYECAATNQNMNWKPADVEMAAYYWWACNGEK